MRAIWPAFFIAILSGLAHPALAQNPVNQAPVNHNSSGPNHSISEKLPLFARNHCEQHKDPANQLFCGDLELNAAVEKLNSAMEARLNRIPDRLLAVEENAQWIKDRNSSCGIFGREPVRFDDIEPVKACLLKETEERTAILLDPNFDCLATNTAAGSLICSEPLLQIADSDLNAEVLALIAKLKEEEAKEAFAEYARWTRDRDRKCNLAGKENVPLQELSPSQDCLAEFMKQRPVLHELGQAILGGRQFLQGNVFLAREIALAVAISRPPCIFGERFLGLFLLQLRDQRERLGGEVGVRDLPTGAHCRSKPAAWLARQSKLGSSRAVVRSSVSFNRQA